MTAGWPALAVVFLLACLLLPAGGDGARPWNDDGGPPQQQQPSWCQNEYCRCTTDGENRVTVKCQFSGEKDVIWESDKNLTKSLVALELNGDGRCNLTVNNKSLAAFAGLRSFSVAGFDGLTVRSQGVMAKNSRTDLVVAIVRVQRLSLDTNVFHPYDGMVDVLVEDCDVVWMGSEVVFKLRSFVFRRIGVLHLSKNTFKNAAQGSAIQTMILEDLTAEKLPSHAFFTSIDELTITNCKFGTIERKAFPKILIGNATLTNVTVDLVESEAFQNSTLITNLRVIGCDIKEMQSDAIVSYVTSIIIEQSEFESVRTQAVVVGNDLTLYNNRFKHVASRGFMLHNLRTVLVYGNRFDRIEAEAFYESSAGGSEMSSVLRVIDNRIMRSGGGEWSAMVQLQKAASETNVTGNTFVGPCGCGPWRFVAVVGTDDGDGDAEFADRNNCKLDMVAAKCANLTDSVDSYRIIKFAEAAGCNLDAGVAYDQCVHVPAVTLLGTTETTSGSGGLVEGGIITTLVLLVLCGFGAVCAVSAVTWLNARGYFIKLRSFLTPNGGRGGGSRGEGGGGGGTACRTVSAHSLSRMSVHEYAELQRVKMGGGVGGADATVRVIVYQDRGTQTVPEELTHEMLQDLRDKLDDPDDYAEARGMIEHLYDLIRVEETCCDGGRWYTAGGGLDDMTSTITTKAVAAADEGQQRDVKSVGTGAPSLDRLRTPRIRAAKVGSADRHFTSGRRPQPPPSPSPSVGDYVDPVDLLLYADGGDAAADVRDDGSYADIYCELADLRSTAEDRPVPLPPQHQEPPPVPDKPTRV